MCKEAGHKMRFVGVQADPETAWSRALDRAESKGRLPDEALFAHSHSIGVYNQVRGFEWLRQQGGEVDTVLIDNTGETPRAVDPATVEIPDFYALYDRIKAMTDNKLGDLTPWHAGSLRSGRDTFKYVEER